jgi:pimeloyl-ACP methyl ester carboxylesterase
MAGPEVVCLHDLGRDARDWESVTTGLRSFGDVRAPDVGRGRQRGSLATSQLRPGTVLVGHSQGALLALELASGSASVRGLIMTGAFYPPARNDQSYATSLGDYARHRVAVAKALASQRARPRRGGMSALASMAALGLRPARFHELAAGVRVPVLVVHGTEDHYVPIGFMHAATRRYPAWDVVVLAGAGHNIHVDQPNDWLDIATPWLRDLGWSSDNHQFSTD